MTSNSERDSVADLPWPEAGPIEPGAHISQAIRRDCTSDLCKKRGLGASQRLALSLLLSGVVIGLLLFVGMRFGRPETALRAALFGAIGWGVVQAGVLFVGLARPPGKRGSRRFRVLLAIGIPIAFFAYLAFAASGHVSLAEFSRGEHAAWALRCGGIALLFGALASGGMLLVWRGTDPLTPGLSGTLAGITGGLAGACAIGCACPASEGWHLLVSHGLMLIALGGVGWVVGRRWLAP
jgi:hypothetical protein